MRSTCPDCGKKIAKHGPPKRVGSFVDQVIYCLSCKWCGVETQQKPLEIKQLNLFEVKNV